MLRVAVRGRAPSPASVTGIYSNYIFNSVRNSSNSNSNSNSNNSNSKLYFKSSSSSSPSSSSRKPVAMALNQYMFGACPLPFDSLGLHPSLCRALSSLGFKHASSIQSRAIPTILSGTDVIIGAETGSGKTLAYAAPAIDRALKEAERTPVRTDPYPSVVVLVPTRELAQQAFDVVSSVLGRVEGGSGRPVRVGALLPLLLLTLLYIDIDADID